MSESKAKLVIVRAPADLLAEVKRIANERYEGNVSQAIRFLLYAGLTQIRPDTKDR